MTGSRFGRDWFVVTKRNDKKLAKKKARAKKARVKHRLAKKRSDLDMKKRLMRHAAKGEDRERRERAQVSYDAKSEEEKIQVPPRNGPCPFHPEYKAKNCPHGCFEMFHRNKARQAGVVHIQQVDEDDKRAGKVGVETDAGAGVLNDLANVLGGL